MRRSINPVRGRRSSTRYFGRKMTDPVVVGADDHPPGISERTMDTSPGVLKERTNRDPAIAQEERKANSVVHE